MEIIPEGYQVKHTAMDGALYVKVKTMVRTVAEIKRDAEVICHKLSAETGMQFSFIVDAPNGKIVGLVFYRTDDSVEDEGC